MIYFNIPFYSGKENQYLTKVIQNTKYCGDGIFTKQCNERLETHLKVKKALLTTSCTHALEMAALLIDIKEGDEVIMPSFTFVSTANAFVLRGAKIIFVDIRPDTMNINEKLIEQAITAKTKAIVPVHYGGISCEMDSIMSIAQKYNLFVIEDAAQGIGAFYKGKALGSIGHIGALSFHETKNIHCGEGGAILINDVRFLERAEIIREKGTNRAKFLRGEVDKYTWVDIGSSYLPSELNAAFLLAQLESVQEVSKKRKAIYDIYYAGLEELEKEGKIELPNCPNDCEGNGHIFYVKTKDINERTELIKHLKKQTIASVFHYIPLHSTDIGMKYGCFIGQDVFTTLDSNRLLRLPMYESLNVENINASINAIQEFYHVA